MLVTITGRHFHVTEPLKKYASNKLKKMDKLARKIKEAHVVLEVQKYQHVAEIALYLKGDRIIAKETAGDMYAAIDNAIENTKTQLRRHMDRLKENHKRGVAGMFSRRFGAFKQKAARQEEPGIVKTRAFASKPMSVEEAALEVKALRREFIVFKNAQTDEVNVVYRRKDGNCGLIEPEF